MIGLLAKTVTAGYAMSLCESHYILHTSGQPETSSRPVPSARENVRQASGQPANARLGMAFGSRAGYAACRCKCHHHTSTRAGADVSIGRNPGSSLNKDPLAVSQWLGLPGPLQALRKRWRGHRRWRRCRSLGRRWGP